jgi:D-lactate dehydrogenase (cytochrome)
MMPDAALADRLKSLLGTGNVVQDASDRAFFSGDIFTQGIVAELVVSPPDVALLAQAVALCTAHGRAVVPRGGGLSYTSGYLPPRAASVVFDLRQLDRIVEINADDMYVTVECGCTWLTLYEALKARGLRTPYFGPASGFSSTIGGALSQGSFLKGSTQHGTTAETTLALDVVLADGTVLSTGSAASMHNPSPFFRTYGPDLTGIFLGDCGALGFKARATLRLIPFPEHARFATYAFDDAASLLAAMRGAAKKGIVSECHGWDPYVVRAFAARGEGFAADLKYLKGVATSGGSFGKGLLDAVKIAVAGKNIFDETHYLMHAIVEDCTAAGADAKFALLQNVAAAQNGRALEPSVPRAIYGTPFTYPNALLGPKGQRWVPVHALSPHSRVLGLFEAMQAFFQSRADILTGHGIEHGNLFFAVGNNTICIEPLFYWPDSRTEYHERMIQKRQLERFPPLAPNPEATQAMRDIKSALATLFMEHGCAHVQIGRAYRYLESRQAPARQLLAALKQALDPHGLVNPGSLGLQ